MQLGREVLNEVAQQLQLATYSSSSTSSSTAAAASSSSSSSGSPVAWAYDGRRMLVTKHALDLRSNGGVWQVKLRPKAKQVYQVGASWL